MRMVRGDPQRGLTGWFRRTAKTTGFRAESAIEHSQPQWRLAPWTWPHRRSRRGSRRVGVGEPVVSRSCCSELSRSERRSRRQLVANLSYRIRDRAVSEVEWSCAHVLSFAPVSHPPINRSGSFEPHLNTAYPVESLAGRPDSRVARSEPQFGSGAVLLRTQPGRLVGALKS